MESQHVRRAIIIVQQGVTPFAKQCLAACAPKLIMEHFQEAELLVNIIQHILVPSHHLLSADEVKMVLTK
jgi:DNA-directed RNA polymerase I, II, and III subunit RPABC1